MYFTYLLTLLQQQSRDFEIIRLKEEQRKDMQEKKKPQIIIFINPIKELLL